MTLALADAMSAKGFPFDVRYDSDRFSRNPNRTCVIVTRDWDALDRFKSTQGVQRNTRRLATRELAVRVHVFAKSSASGARRADHECLSDQITDAVFCTMTNYGSEKKMPVTFLDGRFLSEGELRGTFGEWPGTVYTIGLTIMRGVTDQDFDGVGAPEATLDRVTTTTEAG